MPHCFFAEGWQTFIGYKRKQIREPTMTNGFFITVEIHCLRAAGYFFSCARLKCFAPRRRARGQDRLPLELQRADSTTGVDPLGEKTSWRVPATVRCGSSFLGDRSNLLSESMAVPPVVGE